jgi:MFS family permease
VLSAYVLSNALFEIPPGALGDRIGQRLELTRITTWWFWFTAVAAMVLVAAVLFARVDCTKGLADEAGSTA